MTRFLDDRAPLEATKPSNRQKIVGCPKCKQARSVGLNWSGGICKRCNEYFNTSNALKEDECEGYLNQHVTLNTEFTKLKGEMEAKAYAWKEQQQKKGNLGTRSHEPDNKERNW